MDKIRVLIADDHGVVREGLKRMIGGRAEFSIVGEACNGEEAVALSARAAPDVIVMDLRMPLLGGVEATSRILARDPHARVLVLTTYDTDADILYAVEAGAVGYLLKDSSPEEIFRGIRAAFAGETVLSPSVARKVVRNASGGAEHRLTPTETDVIRQVARGCGNREIAAVLRVSEATVKAHLASIYRKLDARDRASAVAMAIDLGYVRASAAR
jgi:DNA-binding NarL/FixJ family response regulator